MINNNIDTIYHNDKNDTSNPESNISIDSQSSVYEFPFQLTENNYLEKIEFIKNIPDGNCPIEESSVEDIEKKQREFNSNLASLQSWFIRISHSEKLIFVLKLLEVFSVVLKRSTDTLIDILGPVPKDLIYAKTQFTFSKHDMTPIDHNRCLADIPLAEAKTNSISWFSELEEKEQVRVMILLLNLSGSVITFHFYFKAVKYIEKKIKINSSAIEEKLLNYKFYSKMMSDKDSLGGSEFKSEFKSDFGLLSNLDSFGSQADLSSSESSRVIPATSETKILESLKKIGSGFSVASSKYGATCWDYECKLNEWEREFNELIDTSGLREVGTFNENRIPVIDMLQLLPISVNRYIYSLLDSRSKKHLRLINRYWHKSTFIVHKEEHTRQSLDNTIQNWDLRLFKYRSKDFYSDAKYVKSKIHDSQSDQESRKSSRRGTLTSLEPQRSSSEPSLILNENMFKPKYTIKMIPAPTHQYPDKYPKNPYKARFIISEICSRFDHTRCIAANLQWIAMSDKTNISLHSLLTGAPNPCQLTGHTGYVTVLCFHPSKTCLFSGSCDTTIKYWDIYSGKVIITYTNHKSLITGISVNEDHLASVSMDQTLRIFNIESGAMIWQYLFACNPTSVALGRRLEVYLGMEDGSVFKTDLESTPDPDEGEITHAHVYGITCILFDEPFVITGGGDGFVKVWHFEHFDTSAIATFNHYGMTISSVALSFLKVLTTTIDGVLRIWDIYNSKLKREILVNIAKTPIISMICLEVSDHSKVIINSEDVIKVLEFPFFWINFSRACLMKENKEPKIIRGLKRIITTTPADVLAAETQQLRMVPKHRFEKRCRERLQLRHATLPAVVEPSQGDKVTLKEVPIVSKALLDNELLLFPRIIPEPPKMTPYVIKREIFDCGPKILSGLWKYLPRSKKKVLPIYNPSKRSI